MRRRSIAKRSCGGVKYSAVRRWDKRCVVGLEYWNVQWGWGDEGEVMTKFEKVLQRKWERRQMRARVDVDKELQALYESLRVRRRARINVVSGKLPQALWRIGDDT